MSKATKGVILGQAARVLDPYFFLFRPGLPWTVQQPLSCPVLCFPFLHFAPHKAPSCGHRGPRILPVAVSHLSVQSSRLRAPRSAREFAAHLGLSCAVQRTPVSGSPRVCAGFRELRGCVIAAGGAGGPRWGVGAPGNGCVKFSADGANGESLLSNTDECSVTAGLPTQTLAPPRR